MALAARNCSESRAARRVEQLMTHRHALRPSRDARLATALHFYIRFGRVARFSDRSSLRYRDHCTQTGHNNPISTRVVSGTMRPMPQQPTPPAMPEEVMAIIDAIGHRVRTEVLRLLANDAQTAAQLAQATSTDYRQMRRHLAILEELGLVVANTPPDARGPGRGRSVLWHTNIERAEEVGRIWIDYVTGRYAAGPSDAP